MKHPNNVSDEQLLDPENRTFEDIFHWDPYPRVERKIHYTIPGWYLYSMEGDLFFAHGCIDSHGGDRWARDFYACVKCGATPPDGFIAIADMLYKPRRTHAD
jgi:hypothetical protein